MDSDKPVILSSIGNWTGTCIFLLRDQEGKASCAPEDGETLPGWVEHPGAPSSFIPSLKCQHEYFPHQEVILKICF